MSARSRPDFATASPTSRSLPYISAVSMCRYPARRAVLTASAVSLGSIWNTPKPSCGMDRPLFRVICGTAVKTGTLLRRRDGSGSLSASLPTASHFTHAHRLPARSGDLTAPLRIQAAGLPGAIQGDHVPVGKAYPVRAFGLDDPVAELLVVETRVDAAEGQQFTVATRFDDLAVVHGKDDVGGPDGGQPVRDGNGRPPGHERHQGRLDQPLADGVER